MCCGNAVAAAGSKSRIMRMIAHVAITRGVKIVRCRGQHYFHVPQNDPDFEPPQSPAGLYQALGGGNASLGGLASSGASRQEMNDWQMLSIGVVKWKNQID
jgi:hypothetical protein